MATSAQAQQTGERHSVRMTVRPALGRPWGAQADARVSGTDSISGSRLSAKTRRSNRFLTPLAISSGGKQRLLALPPASPSPCVEAPREAARPLGDARDKKREAGRPLLLASLS